jgi:hypothetical protein
MVFPLRKIVNFAMQSPAEVDYAYKEFFGELPFSELETQWEELFLEWLIFDFKTSIGESFLAKYIFRNTDNLDKKTIRQFEQISKTQFYSEFEILKLKRGKWILAEDMFAGKKYTIYEKKGSEVLPEKGTIPGRIANVDGKWYLVGANSIYFPIAHTERLKKHMREMKISNFSPKDTVQLLRSKKNSPPEPVHAPTKKELKKKRESLEKKYEQDAQKFGTILSFSKLTEEIYSEDRVSVLDFWMSLEEKGLKEKMIMEDVSLLQDIWNYFPHKCLNGLSPIEAYTKFKK